MHVMDLKAGLNPTAAGDEMYRLISDLYPLCRSITGNGLRETLRLVQRHIPIELHEVPSGTRVFDWTVPKEWNIADAWIKDSQGRRVVDFQRSNLHVVNYSIPVHASMRLSELRMHLFTLPEHPDWIPYRTTYYSENWGFCLSHNEAEKLHDEVYEVCIDSSLEPGCLTFGEYYLPGASADEVLISCHACHPSLCNDNLSGVALATALARRLTGLELRYSYRFLFVPGTIGSITWLSLNAERAHQVKHGLVVAGVGDPGPFTYKKSRRGDAEVDRVVEHVLKHSDRPYEIQEFSPYGYDERQYCSPGFNLPVGSLTRTPYGRYPQYHTSADDLGFIRRESLGDALATYVQVLSVLELNGTYRNLNPNCEPQLGKRGLYGSTGPATDPKKSQMALLWVLNLSDCRHSLLDIADRSGLEFDVIRKAAHALQACGLLQQVQGSGEP